MKWYEITLRQNGKMIIRSGLFLVIFSVITGLQGYFSGETFIWTKIETISYPSILNWRFYSALAFITLGSFLFSRGLWIFIYQISTSKSSYRRNKKDVWTLITLTTFGLMILVIKILNILISILFNVLLFILYSLPSVLVTLILMGGGYLIFNKYKTKII